MVDTKKIAGRRQELGLSMRAAAKAAGMSLGHWFDVEHGRWQNPKLATIERVAQALRCTVSHLLREKPIRQKAVA